MEYQRVSGVPTGPWGWCLALLMVPLIAGCSGGAQPRSQDATVVDRASTKDQTTIDRAADDDVPTGPDVSFDASADLGLDTTVDVALDAAVDVSVDAVDVPDPWDDAPRVDLGGILVPVDPHAVPAPGSECTGDGGVRMGDPTIAPPRPIRPLSVSRVTSQRPTFQWVLPDGTTGARVEVCADRCCTRVLQTIDAEGTTVRPMTALPPGVVFWRMFGRRGTVVGSRASYTWEFGVRHRDAPNDTSWGTIRDFNGDGFDDLFMFRPRSDSDRSDLLLVPGSSERIRAPITTAVSVPGRASNLISGDFNGDGLLDLSWIDGDRSRSWSVIVSGTRGVVRTRSLNDYRSLGACARPVSYASVDWNGDGFSDLLTSLATGCSSGEPVVFSILLLYEGSSIGLAAVPQRAWRLDRLFAHPFVRVTAGLGDIDPDGYDDIAITSLFSGGGTSSIPARVVILHGGQEDLVRLDDVPQPLPRAGEWDYARPAPIGDVDGDGHVDLLFSLNYSNPIYIYRHDAGLSMPSSVLSDPLRGANFGFWLSSGDVNGDGLSDVILSSQLAFENVIDSIPVDRGRVYIFLGEPGGLAMSPQRVARDPNIDAGRFDYFGDDPVSPGDFNGDGFDDIFMQDTVRERLCIRYGRTGLADGPPDYCADGAISSPSGGLPNIY